MMKKFLSKIKNIVSSSDDEENKKKSSLKDKSKVKNVLFLTDMIGISAYTLTNSWVSNVQGYLREKGIKNEVVSDIAMHVNFIENTFRDTINIHHFDLIIASIGYNTTSVSEFREITDRLTQLVKDTKTKVVFLEIPPIEEAFENEIIPITVERIRNIRSQIIQEREYKSFDVIETFQSFLNQEGDIDKGLFVKSNHLPNMKGNRILGELVIGYLDDIIKQEEN